MPPAGASRLTAMRQPHPDSLSPRSFEFLQCQTGPSQCCGQHRPCRGQELLNRAVGQPVGDGIALPARLDQSGPLHHRQVLGKRRRLKSHLGKKGTDRLLPLHQEFEDPDPGRVAEGSKEVGLGGIDRLIQGGEWHGPIAIMDSQHSQSMDPARHGMR